MADVGSAGKRRRHLEDVDGSDNDQPISKNKLISDHSSVSERSRQRRTSNEMSHLTSPEGTATASSRRPITTAVSRKTTASVYDTDYRVTLEKYNTYIMEEDPPPEFVKRARNIISRQRETPELDDAAIKGMRSIMRELQNEGEEEVKNKVGAVIIPGFSAPPNKKLSGVSGTLWAKTVPVPLDLTVLAAPLPLPKPKPDKAFGYAKPAFSPSQLAAINLLAQSPVGSSFASPSEGLPFPFFVIEVKSQAKDGSIRVARNQAAGAGAIAMNGILELVSRGPGLDGFDFNQPLFFSVTMDQERAGINAHWIGKNPQTDQHTFHLEELKMLPLKYDDSVQVLQGAIKNIFDYAADLHLKPILDALDEYRRKIIAQRNADSVEKTLGNVQSGVLPSSLRPPRLSKRVKRASAPSKNGRAASKAQEATIVCHGRASRKIIQSQAEAQPPDACKRVAINLADFEDGYSEAPSMSPRLTGS